MGTNKQHMQLRALATLEQIVHELREPEAYSIMQTVRDRGHRKAIRYFVESNMRGAFTQPYLDAKVAFLVKSRCIQACHLAGVTADWPTSMRLVSATIVAHGIDGAINHLRRQHDDPIIKDSLAAYVGTTCIEACGFLCHSILDPSFTDSLPSHEDLLVDPFNQ